MFWSISGSIVIIISLEYVIACIRRRSLERHTSILQLLMQISQRHSYPFKIVLSSMNSISLQRVKKNNWNKSSWVIVAVSSTQHPQRSTYDDLMMLSKPRKIPMPMLIETLNSKVSQFHLICCLSYFLDIFRGWLLS